MSITPDFKGYFNRYLLFKQYYLSNYAPYINVDIYRVIELGEPTDIELPEVTNEIMFAVCRGQVYVKHNMLDLQLVETYKDLIESYKYDGGEYTLYYHISVTKTDVFIICYATRFVDSTGTIYPILESYSIESYKKITDICRQITNNFEIIRHCPKDQHVKSHIKHNGSGYHISEVHCQLQSIKGKLAKKSTNYPEVAYVDMRRYKQLTIDQINDELIDIKERLELISEVASHIVRTSPDAEAYITKLITAENEKKKEIDNTITGLILNMESLKRKNIPNLKAILEPTEVAVTMLRKNLLVCDENIAKLRSFMTE